MIALLAAQSGELPAPHADWFADFVPFSLQHLVCSGAFLGLIAAAILLGLKHRNTPFERNLRHIWGIFALLTMIIDAIWWCRPDTFDIRKSLPLYVCDIAGWLAAFYLLTNARLARLLLYYFGLFLSSQAFVTPVIGTGQGLANGRFWLFYLTHTHIVGVAMYDLIVLRYRPTWRDCALAIAIGVAYVLSMIVLNRIIGHDANYGFMGSGNDQPGVILKFGAYPLRLLWLGLFVTGLFIVATAAWRLFPSKSAPSSASPSAPYPS